LVIKTLARVGSGSRSVFSLKRWIRILNKWIRIRNTGMDKYVSRYFAFNLSIECYKINFFYKPFFRNRVLLVSPVFCVLRQSSVLKGLSSIRWEGKGVINTEQQYSLSLYGILLRLVCLFACVSNRGYI
jgi:hypothetical protein